MPTISQQKKLPIWHLIVLFAGAAYLISGCFSNSLWFDESFTVGLMNHTSLFEMIKWSSYDVHPHLYYIILWFYTRVFGTSIPVMRLFSALFAVAFASLGLTHIRRDFGDRIGFWFTTVTYLLGATLTYALQIRMYTMAMYLVGLTAIYAYRIARGEATKKNCILFAVFSIASAYTHYFALFTVAAINVMLLVRTILQKDSVKRWLVLGAAQICAYLPGAYVFRLQIKTGGADWIRLLWPDTVYNLVSYHLVGDELYTFFETTKQYRYGGLVFLALYVLAGIVLYRRTRRAATDSDEGNTAKTREAVRWSLYAYFGVVLFSMLVSLVREIFYIRYTMVLFVFTVFVIAYLIATSKDAWKKAVAVILLVALAAYPVYGTFRLAYDPSADAVTDTLDGKVEKGDIFFFEGADVFVATVRYPDNMQYYYNGAHWKVEKTYRSFGPNARVLDSLDCPEINEFRGRVWVTRGACYDYLMSLGDCREVTSTGTIHLENHNYNFEFVLIEKGMN